MSQEIKVKYEYASDYRKIPATGAWGGLTPNGEVVVNFFVEFITKPESVKIKIDETGIIEQKSQEVKNTSWTRELLVGVVMRPDIAKSVGHFLLRYAEEGEKALTQIDGNIEKGKGESNDG